MTQKSANGLLQVNSQWKCAAAQETSRVCKRKLDINTQLDSSPFIRVKTLFVWHFLMYAEGNIGVCGIAVLNNFSCGISAILTSKCDIAVFSATLRNAVFQHFGLYSKLFSLSSNVSRAFSSFRLTFLMKLSSHGNGKLWFFLCRNRKRVS